ncbi:MAG TPA: 50S ribosomal protein L24 [Candidatus Saccharimonadales bacterium]|nr:50S ribosomal protein L24 [Candidatus Saccharimonadales bacterium]
MRKDDTVMVLSGKQARSKGRVLRVYPDTKRAVVEGVNFVKRHTRPNPSRNVQGGIVEREASIHISNLMVICPECGEPTRVGHKLFEDGERLRVCRRCQGIVDRK